MSWPGEHIFSPMQVIENDLWQRIIALDGLDGTRETRPDRFCRAHQEDRSTKELNWSK